MKLVICEDTPATPCKAGAQPCFEWTPAEKPLRQAFKGGNVLKKEWQKCTECKCCGLEKQPRLKDAKSSHGAACGYCRALLIHHGRRHLGLKGAGRLEDFSKEQLAAA